MSEGLGERRRDIAAGSPAPVERVAPPASGRAMECSESLRRDRREKELGTLPS